MYDSAYTSKNCIFYSLEIKLVYSEYWFFLLLVNCFIFNYVCVDFTVTLMYVWRLTVKDFWYYFFFLFLLPSHIRIFSGMSHCRLYNTLQVSYFVSRHLCWRELWWWYCLWVAPISNLLSILLLVSPINSLVQQLDFSGTHALVCHWFPIWTRKISVYVFLGILSQKYTLLYQIK